MDDRCIIVLFILVVSPIAANRIDSGNIRLWTLSSNDIVNWWLNISRQSADVMYTFDVKVLNGMSAGIITVQSASDDISTNRATTETSTNDAYLMY